MALSQSDLFSLAKKAGLSDDRAKVAAAIAMAESGGDPNAHNTNASTGDDSYGLWQINMKGDLGPERRKQFNILVDGQLIDPTQNAKAMASVSSKGGNFNAWTTYTTTDPKKTYKRFLNNPVAETGVDYNQNILQQKTGVAIPANPLEGLLDAVGKTAHWVSDSKNWIRVAYVGGGIVLAIGALVTLASGTKAGAVATKVATKGLV